MNMKSSRRDVFQTIAVALFVLAAPVAAQATVVNGGISSGRAGAIVAALVGLISVIIGRLALTRSVTRIGTGQGRAIVSLVLGLIGMALSVLHQARSAGGIGTGNGRAGAIVALVLGLIGVVLGGLAVARSRRNAGRSNTTATANPVTKV